MYWSKQSILAELVIGGVHVQQLEKSKILGMLKIVEGFGI